MKTNLLDNHLFIFFLFISTAVISTITSIYFFTIFFAGILFLAFMRCIKNKAYYSLFFVILAFLFIEINNGFRPFSLVLLSTFIYTFIVPYIKRVVSIHNLNNYVYMLCFYLGLAFVWSFFYKTSIYLFGVIFLNILIDFVIFGFFI